MIERWESPPALRERDIWKRTYLELCERPGEWAYLGIFEAKYVKNTVRKVLYRRGARVVTRTKAGKVKVWAMVPADGEGEPQ